MKRLTLTIVAAAISLLSVNVMAEAVGVVDMQTVFHSSSQIQKINQNLNKEFSSRKQSIISMGQSLQANLAKYKKDSLVMKQSQLNTLKTQITKQEIDLRQAQARFQQDLFAAQNKSMASFMDDVKASVQKIAESKKLDLVLPKNAVLYSKGSLNITDDVLKSLD
ncbi:MAG: OmpH family outer membrane protein [Gammaproteobacteria bacterium]|nr:OmpH family outer membrane protein [Gammaproteobacteria bacterium]MCH9744045.1 OmpH family outer membrane protein [Gammaproteobacteria bacterium]